MGCNPGGIVGIVSSLKDDAQPCLLPVGSVSDGADCQFLLCTLSIVCSNSNGGSVVWGVLFVWDDEMKVDVDVDANGLFHDTLGKTNEGCVSL